MATNVVKQLLGRGASIECIFCKTDVPFASLPPKYYLDHLLYSHGIEYDSEAVVERTLKLQFPLILPEYRSSLNLTSDISTQTGSFDKKEAATTNGVVIPIIPLIKAEKNVRNSGGDQVGKIGNNLPASSPEVQLLVEPNPSQNNSALKSVPASKVGPKISSEDVAQVPSTSDTRVVPSTSTSATAVPIANEWKKVRLPWYAGSEYRCNICSVLFFYNQDLRAHVKKDHCDPDEYLDKYETFETKASFIFCKCCEKKIKRHFSSVRNHLTTEHGLSMEEYQGKFKFALEHDVIVDGPLGYEEVAIENKRKRQGSGERSGKKQQVQDEFEPREKMWFDGCEYQCLIVDCGLVFFEANVLILHLQKSHSLSFVDYQIQFKNFETKVEWFTCPAPECGAKIKHVRSTLENHALSTHDLNLDEFESKFISLKEASNFGEGKDEGTFTTWSKGRCLFVCSVCLNETRESTEFWRHSSSEHDLEEEDYKSKFGDPCVESVKTQCKICGNSLLHDLPFIELHTSEVHKLSAKAYFDDYIKPKNKKDKLKTVRPGPKSKVQKKKGKLSKIRKALEGCLPSKTNSGQKTNIQFTRWKNACIFGCQICQNFSSRWPSDFKSHVHSKHKISFDVYLEMFADPMTVIVDHECRICCQKVLQTVGKLTPHVGRHKLSLENYFRKFMLGMEIEETPSTSTTVPKMPAKNSMHQSWADKCLFFCKHCDFESAHRGVVTIHVKKVHNLSTETVTEGKGHVLAKTLNHYCLICGMKLRHTSGVIQKHLRLRHQIDLENYFHLFVETSATPQVSEWKNGCTFRCCHCQYKTHIAEDFAKHMELHNVKMDMFKQTYKAMIEQKAVISCKICKAVVLHESFSLEEHFEKIHDTTLKIYFDAHVAPAVRQGNLAGRKLSYSWMNKCLFSCKICQKIFCSFTDVEKHMSQVHATTIEMYESVHGSAILKVTFVPCNICQSAMPCDAELISKHLLSSHQMSLAEYDSVRKQTSVHQDGLTPSDTLKFSWNQSKRFCGICDEDCTNSSISGHIQLTHNLSISDYNLKHVTPVQNISHRCLLCQHEVIFSQRHVELHLKSHEISLLQYEQMYQSQILNQHPECLKRRVNEVEPIYPNAIQPVDLPQTIINFQESNLLEDPMLNEVDAFIAQHGQVKSESHQWSFF